jgi:uncharacterized repeat protein (TIGR03803 family)
MSPDSREFESTAIYKRGEELWQGRSGPVPAADADPRSKRATLASLEFEWVFGREPEATRRSPIMQWQKSILHNFGEGVDGVYPWLGLAFDAAGNLYGSTLNGGSANFGTVYRLTPNPDGTWIENVIYAFQGGTDGQWPYGSVVIDNAGNVYGTTSAEGLGSNGWRIGSAIAGGGKQTWRACKVTARTRKRSHNKHSLSLPI